MKFQNSLANLLKTNQKSNKTVIDNGKNKVIDSEIKINNEL